MFIEITDYDLESNGFSDARRFIMVNHIISFRACDKYASNGKSRTHIHVTGDTGFTATEGCDLIQVRINRALRNNIPEKLDITALHN